MHVVKAAPVSTSSFFVYLSYFFIAASAGITYIHGVTRAHAASPIGNAGTAKTDKGALSAEWRGGFTRDGDDKRFQMRQHVDYGFSDWYALRLITAQDKRDGDNMEHRSFTFENRIQFIEREKHGWDGGIRLGYGHSDGDKTPHELDFRLMAQIPFGREKDWELRHNTILEHDIGEDSRNGAFLELRNQITKEIDGPSYVKSLRLGLEMFNDFGRLRDSDGFGSQDHQLGPVLKASFKNGFYIQTGYRAGLSDDAADHLFKLFAGKKF